MTVSDALRHPWILVWCTTSLPFLSLPIFIFWSRCHRDPATLWILFSPVNCSKWNTKGLWYDLSLFWKYLLLLNKFCFLGTSGNLSIDAKGATTCARTCSTDRSPPSTIEMIVWKCTSFYRSTQLFVPFSDRWWKAIWDTFLLFSLAGASRNPT